jgi:uncharacterized protein YndB with AHSA1/START domain
MKKRSVTHNTFVIERVYEATPARVFAAFADPAIKARWFAGPEGWSQDKPVFDFHVGGRERAGGGPKGGPVHRFDAIYQDIVPNERIVYTYEMHMDDTRISVSLATLQFKAEGGGTRLILTEQGAYLDGHDIPAQREAGTRELLANLDKELKRSVGVTRAEDDVHTHVSDLVRRCFAAYETKDRQAIEGLLSDDFSFTSPYDDHIDRKVYFERCWPNSANMSSFRVLELVERGDDAFILYEAQFKGSEICRNTEFFRTEGNKIKAVEVYFGSPARSQTT